MVNSIYVANICKESKSNCSTDKVITALKPAFMRKTFTSHILRVCRCSEREQTTKAAGLVLFSLKFYGREEDMAYASVSNAWTLNSYQH